MALTRKFLTALGIEQDKVEEIIAAHTEVTDGLTAKRDALEAEVKKYKADAERLADVEKELKDLKASGSDETPFKTEYEKIKTEYEKFKNDVKAEKDKARKTDAYKKILTESGVSEKRMAGILKLSSEQIDKLEFDEDGKVKDLDKIKSSIKDEWADFIEKQEQKGATTATPPATNGGEGRKTSRAAEMVAKYQREHYGAPVEAKKEG